MLLRNTGRLEWPDTLTAKMPKAWMMLNSKTSCPAGGCSAHTIESGTSKQPAKCTVKGC